MNKVERKIFRGVIEKKLSDQDAFSDSDGDDPKQNETIIKTEVSNYRDNSIYSNIPYLAKNQSIESIPQISMDDFCKESKNKNNSYSKIREMLNNEYSTVVGTSIYDSPGTISYI